MIPNIYLYLAGLRSFPEFAGYKARRYPGQKPPRNHNILPKGQKLDFESLATDIQKIKTRPPIVFITHHT